MLVRQFEVHDKIPYLVCKVIGCLTRGGNDVEFVMLILRSQATMHTPQNIRGVEVEGRRVERSIIVWFRQLVRGVVEE